MNDKLIILDGYIVFVGVNHPRYAEITEALHSKPSAPDGYDYRLKDTLEWELYELPPMPEDDELSAEEALEIITGGYAE